jgi:hypothetical protein
VDGAPRPSQGGMFPVRRRAPQRRRPVGKSPMRRRSGDTPRLARIRPDSQRPDRQAGSGSAGRAFPPKVTFTRCRTRSPSAQLRSVSAPTRALAESCVTSGLRPGLDRTEMSLHADGADHAGLSVAGHSADQRVFPPGFRSTVSSSLPPGAKVEVPASLTDTPAGRKALRSANRQHLADVRELFLNHVTHEQLEVLAEAWRRVKAANPELDQMPAPSELSGSHAGRRQSPSSTKPESTGRPAPVPSGRLRRVTS